MLIVVDTTTYGPPRRQGCFRLALNNLLQRIRSRGAFPGQDGDPRSLILIITAASRAVPCFRFQAAVRLSVHLPSTTRRLQRPVRGPASWFRRIGDSVRRNTIFHLFLEWLERVFILTRALRRSHLAQSEGDHLWQSTRLDLAQRLIERLPGAVILALVEPCPQLRRSARTATNAERFCSGIALPPIAHPP